MYLFRVAILVLSNQLYYLLSLCSYDLLFQLGRGYRKHDAIPQGASYLSQLSKKSKVKSNKNDN